MEILELFPLNRQHLRLGNSITCVIIVVVITTIIKIIITIIVMINPWHGQESTTHPVDR